MLAVRTRDIAAAEDALSDAFVSALRTWPERGVPDNPDAWLLTAARNTVKNVARHRNVAETAAVAMALEQSVLPSEPAEFPDQRLRLLFVCAHPAIDESVRTPLMLQTVLGLDAAHIAAAFLVAPTTLGQRLVRAKAKIKDAGLRFELPSTADMADRMADVLNAIYVAFGTGWDSVAGAEAGPRDLTGEALFLCRLIVTFLPNEPEARGLLALMLYCEARRPARRGEAGEFIPLREQDHHRWSRDMIVEAEGHLISASRHGTFGRFQCEAAIQSVHVQAPLTGRTNHEALETLYQLLAHHCPSVGVLVSQAAALVDAGDADKALVVLGRLPEADVRSYQPYWVTRANALGAKGDLPAAARALDVAIGLTEDPAVRAFLVQSRRF
jgi:RNA polymerase sigma-70 factor (ECF subfamily)